MWPDSNVRRHQTGDRMQIQASGTFEVKLTPQLPDDQSVGRMTIEIADGKHLYTFEYTVAETS